MGVELPIPDHTTLARRRRSVMVDQAESPRRGPMDIVLDSTGLKLYGPGEWSRAKHGEKRRSWRTQAPRRDRPGPRRDRRMS
jgi:hypothetical protein